MIQKYLKFLVCLCAVIGVKTCPVHAQTYDTYQYWLMPAGLVSNQTLELLNGNTVPAQHCYWRGTLWGKTVALGGDPTMLDYDLYVDNGGTELDYYSTFKGNAQTGTGTGYSGPNSSVFNKAFVFLQRYMTVGQTVQTTNFVDKIMDTDQRAYTGGATLTGQMTVTAHYNQYTIPETGQTYNDVLLLTFYSDVSNPAAEEQYWCANGDGFIRSQLYDTSSPTNAHVQYVNATNPFTQLTQNNTPAGGYTGGASSAVSYPASPWYDPFITPVDFANHAGIAYVPNGLFINNSGSNGSPVGNNTNLPAWNQSSSDCVITTSNPPPGLGPWNVCLKGTQGGGSGKADYIITSTYTPVNAGVNYTISAWVFRSSPSDNVYIDMNDGQGSGQNFTEAQANAKNYGTWEYVSASTTVGTGTTGIRVRCVRDGANSGNAYFYGVTLQRTGSN